MTLKFQILILSLILTAGSCFCQTANDSTYWEAYEPKKISISGYLSRNSINIESDKKNYTPNIPMNIGTSVAVKNTIVYLEYRFGLTPLLDPVSTLNNSVYVSRSNTLNLTAINMKIAYTKTFDLKRVKE